MSYVVVHIAAITSSSWDYDGRCSAPPAQQCPGVRPPGSCFPWVGPQNWPSIFCRATYSKTRGALRGGDHAAANGRVHPRQHQGAGSRPPPRAAVTAARGICGQQAPFRRGSRRQLTFPSQFHADFARGSVHDAWALGSVSPLRYGRRWAVLGDPVPWLRHCMVEQAYHRRLETVSMRSGLRG